MDKDVLVSYFLPAGVTGDSSKNVPGAMSQDSKGLDWLCILRCLVHVVVWEIIKVTRHGLRRRRRNGSRSRAECCGEIGRLGACSRIQPLTFKDELRRPARRTPRVAQHQNADIAERG